MDSNQEEDALLLENIDEFVNDENKIVTYKWMSVTLQLDVNRSKRLLEKFSEKQNDLNVIYFVGGWKETDTSTKKLSYALVKKENLLKAKERFSSLTCCDIYSVQKCVIQDSCMLYSADSDLVTNALDSLHKYNTIQCKDKNAKRPQKYIANGCSLSEPDINHSKKAALSAPLSGNLTVPKTVPIEKKSSKNEDTKESPLLSFFGNKQIAKKQGSNTGNVSKESGIVKSNTPKPSGKFIEIPKTEKVVNKTNEALNVKVEEKSNTKNEEIKNVKKEKLNKEVEETCNKKTDEVSNMKTEEKSDKAEEKSNKKILEKPNKKIEEQSNNKNEENKKKTDENLLESSSKKEEKNFKKNQSLTFKRQENSTVGIENQKAEERQKIEEKNHHKGRKTEEADSSPKKKKISPKKRKFVHEESDSEDDFENFIEKSKSSSKHLSLTKSSKKNIKPATNEDDDIDVDVVAPTPEPPEKLKIKRRKKSKMDSEAERDSSTQERASFDINKNMTNANSTTDKKRGQRMVMKSKQYVDDEGYMVTRRNLENESFSEDSEPEIQQEKITDEKLTDANEITSNGSMKTEKTSTVSKLKSKHQASLMSFFKKN